jgi:hypothetical protein
VLCLLFGEESREGYDIRVDLLNLHGVVRRHGEGALEKV